MGVESTPPLTVTVTGLIVAPAKKLTVTDVGTEFVPLPGLFRAMVTGVPIVPLGGLTENAGALAPAVTTVVVNVPFPAVLIVVDWLHPTVVDSGETVRTGSDAVAPESPLCESIAAVSIASPLESVTISEAFPQVFT